MRRQLMSGLMALLAGSLVTTAVASDQTKMEEERQKHRDQVAQKLSETARLLTAFDYVVFNLSGPAVVLQGFATKPTIKEGAEKAVRQLDWVSHVVNEIEDLPVEPGVNDIRKESLSMLRKACPQAFPENHAYMRIKVDGAYNVTLVGFIDPGDEKRLEVAVTRIKQLPLVKDVENKVLTKK